MICQQCGQPCRVTFSVTRHKSLLPASLTHALKSWYAVRVCPECIGPERTQDEDRRVDLAYMARREIQR